jgi:hypothetical protein
MSAKRKAADSEEASGEEKQFKRAKHNIPLAAVDEKQAILVFIEVMDGDASFRIHHIPCNATTETHGVLSVADTRMLLAHGDMHSEDFDGEDDPLRLAADKAHEIAKKLPLKVGGRMPANAVGYYCQYWG